jgi:ATP-binding cassette subfamily C (CFTR/MRP) protein 10
MDAHRLCGANGSLDILQSGYISSCFIQLFVICPIHAILAAVNVFYIAKQQRNPFCALVKLLRTVQLLSVLVVLLVITQVACSLAGLEVYHSVSYFLSLAFIAFAWLLTSIYMQRKNRPPFLLCTLLVLSWGSTVVEFSTLIFRICSENEDINGKHDRVENYCTVIQLLFQTFAIIIVIWLRVKSTPNEAVNQLLHRGIQAEGSETDRLLGSENYHVYYSGLSKQPSSNELTKVDENSGLFSSMTFWWVYKLMKKGLVGNLKNAEDLFYLPTSLSTKEIAVSFQRILQELHKSLLANSDNNSKEMQSNGTEHLLLKALHKAFGVRYYSIGILKFVGDCLGFAGPLLLHALVAFMENKNVSIE